MRLRHIAGEQKKKKMKPRRHTSTITWCWHLKYKFLQQAKLRAKCNFMQTFIGGKERNKKTERAKEMLIVSSRQYELMKCVKSKQTNNFNGFLCIRICFNVIGYIPYIQVLCCFFSFLLYKMKYLLFLIFSRYWVRIARAAHTFFHNLIFFIFLFEIYENELNIL